MNIYHCGKHLPLNLATKITQNAGMIWNQWPPLQPVWIFCEAELRRRSMEIAHLQRQVGHAKLRSGKDRKFWSIRLWGHQFVHGTLNSRRCTVLEMAWACVFTRWSCFYFRTCLVKYCKSVRTTSLQGWDALRIVQMVRRQKDDPTFSTLKHFLGTKPCK